MKALVFPGKGSMDYRPGIDLGEVDVAKPILTN